ncbi:hypothetical protein [Treponema porcinum]|uniref:Uncharacterized protein n=1 Tax=Treponema porcinum TaxID=261392 RepID=A0A1T4JKQ3_TREPO|nr:hypothetical protein [Treponema porcinum]SJZ30693.1 hypothetical protein SAMN02745149_00520 [Treponema porcinum]
MNKEEKLMNKKILILILLLSVISVSCFFLGLICPGITTICPRITTNKTIITEINSLERDLRIEKMIKTYSETQMSYMDEDLANTTLDEHERLICLVNKKDVQQSIKESERRIEKLTKKINKRYERLRNRNPEFKGASNY